MAARLRVTGGHNVDHVYKVDDDQAAIFGRSSSADVRVSDDNASRKHCRLERVDGHWTITDLKSLNGTHVNRKRIDAVRLSSGDEIRIAGTIYEFTIDGEPAPDAGEELDGDETELKDAPAEAQVCVCAQCGRDLPKNAADAGSVTEIGGRLFCSRCVVRHSGPEGEAVEPGHAAEEPQETGESSEFASLLKSLERATEADRLDEDKAPPPAPEAEPPKPGASLLDRLRSKKQRDQ